MPSRLDTTISGKSDPKIIKTAVDSFLNGVVDLIFPPEIAYSGLAKMAGLKPQFLSRAKKASAEIVGILEEINQRAQILRSREYADLAEKEFRSWSPDGEKLSVGVSACVDRGIASEAVSAPDASMGRTLAGDIPFSHIASKNSFVLDASALKKRLIHGGRGGGGTVLELLVEHTGCGRRGQMLANEASGSEVPDLGYVFDRVESLAGQFAGSVSSLRGVSPLGGRRGNLSQKNNIEKGLGLIKKLWENYEKKDGAVLAPDGGLWAGVVAKIAQRQALENLPLVKIVAPVEIFDKSNANLIVGADSLSALTHPIVLREGGFTAKALDELANKGIIFSLKNEAVVIARSAATWQSMPNPVNYADLQSDWLNIQSKISGLTQKLWVKYRSEKTDKGPLTGMVNRFLDLSLSLRGAQRRGNLYNLELIKARMTHQLFRCLAYTTLLGTFEKGHPSGKHLEDHLATGDHSTGAKRHLALGQGDLSRPSAAEIFTGYTVLLHSKPGHDGTPIPLFIKVDTERESDQPMTTEETDIATSDMREALKLWPYMAVGDLIPVVTVRGKITGGGVDRLPYSIVANLGSIVEMNEGRNKVLPDLVPALNTKGKMVMVPASAVIEAGLNAGDDLKDFRAKVMLVADRFSDPAVQRSFRKNKN